MFPGEPSAGVVRPRFIKSPYDAGRVLFPRPRPQPPISSRCWSAVERATRALEAGFYFGQGIGGMNLTRFSFLFAVGLYYCFSNLSDARIFIIMYGVTSMYFSAVMVRAAEREQGDQLVLTKLMSFLFLSLLTMVLPP